MRRWPPDSAGDGGRGDGAGRAEQDRELRLSTQGGPAPTAPSSPAHRPSPAPSSRRRCHVRLHGRRPRHSVTVTLPVPSAAGLHAAGVIGRSGQRRVAAPAQKSRAESSGTCPRARSRACQPAVPPGPLGVVRARLDHGTRRRRRGHVVLVRPHADGHAGQVGGARGWWPRVTGETSTGRPMASASAWTKTSLADIPPSTRSGRRRARCRPRPPRAGRRRGGRRPRARPAPSRAGPCPG